MAWFLFVVAACGLVLLGKGVSRIDQVYGLSIYGASVFSGLWGFAIAPASAQLGLEVLVLGWVQARCLRP
ncbi:hypothetical protein [Lyngbya confervoides]|uniref:Uncharacterized protein n=1 Tax=Lyngbya confervoides BDU141951 TaxID=1574623 RepID=A0ABD4T057_9CYAN|nr:hypothetical protein [Lyngbya confervoides]MCM1982051.1 hypothetical protein [Lyngbya confervoides BDU141951]